jgi:putative hemolysin
VKQIMKPRVSVQAVEISTNFKTLLDKIVHSGFSRIPVYEENFDTISGVLYIKDLLVHLDAPENFEWQQLLRPSFFVPESKKIDDLLKEFQEKKIHLAIVIWWNIRNCYT